MHTHCGSPSAYSTPRLLALLAKSEKALFIASACGIGNVRLISHHADEIMAEIVAKASGPTPARS
jgi:hypothetical protein